MTLLHSITNAARQPFPSLSASSSSSTAPLAQADYPYVKYWQKGLYHDATKKHGITQLEDGTTQKITATSFHFAEDKDGTPPTSHLVTDIRSAAGDILHDLGRAGLLVGSGWSKVGFAAKERFREELERRFPILRLCHNHWKADWVVTQIYSNFKTANGDRYFLKGEEQNDAVLVDSNTTSPPPSPKRKSDSLDTAANKRAKVGTSIQRPHQTSRKVPIILQNPLRGKTITVPAKQVAGTSSRSTARRAVSSAAAPPPADENTPPAASAAPPGAPASTETFDETLDDLVSAIPTTTTVITHGQTTGVDKGTDDLPNPRSPSPTVANASSLDVLARAASSLDTPSASVSLVATSTPAANTSDAASTPTLVPDPSHAVSSAPAAAASASGPSRTQTVPDTEGTKTRKNDNQPWKPPRNSTTAKTFCGIQWLKTNKGGTQRQFREHYEDKKKKGELQPFKDMELKAKQAAQAALAS
ncbi:hypothetical protein FB45DRAFT_934525 [Roridomyces roridus]|uniref:Uncharacterized protein n=1 Tax=Roridomyces roridus TaxID=1738132 RepID=A0AAD7BCB3_9AGAR|nr:hypothetical protein FB45DRAFT_934525 [Roridomyces roridus]